MTTEQRQERRREESASAEACEDENSCESGESGDDVEASDAPDHLSDVPDGSGCAEIWEHLSEEREDDD